LAQCRCAQVSIETAQSSLDCAVLEQLTGKKIIVGVIDLSDPAVESPEVVANRIRRALPFVDPKNLLIAPDCGMKYLPRETAFGKLQAMVAGAQMVRTQLEKGKGQG
jgi:5-methyltetrahydropteroyltriglutamate--homocysteine methyltransferase